MEDDLLSELNKKKLTETEKDDKNRKFEKLPVLSASKDDQKRVQKIKGSCKLIDTKYRKDSFPNTDLSLRKEASCGSGKAEAAIHELSQKMLKNIRIREPILPKKKPQPR